MLTSQIVSALRQAYCQPEWSIFFEVSDGTGAANRRRADAVAMNMRPSRGLELRAFEIKISVSDLKSELKDPSKAEAISQYCNTFYLVTPKGLSEGTCLPPTWGLIEVSNSGKIRIRKQSDFNKTPMGLTKNFIASLLRSSSKIDESEIKARLGQELIEIRKSESENYKRRLDYALQNKNIDKAAHKALFSKVTSILGKDVNRLLYDENFLDTIKIIQLLGITSKWKGFSKISKDLKSIAKDLIGTSEILDIYIKKLKPQKRKKLINR